MNQNLPPDGFADEPSNGPPDGFADESSNPQYGMKDYVGDIARPIFEGGGAVAGGIVGAPLGPLGAAGGGALGFAGGKAAADLLDRGLGRKPFLRNASDAIKETGGDLMSGAAAEATGQVAGKVVPSILKGAAKLRNMAGEWANAIPAKDYQAVADNPISMWPGKLEQAGNRFETAAQNAGISSELTPKAVERIRHPGSFAFDTYERIAAGEKVTPQDVLHARQNLDAIYPVPNKKNGQYIRMLDQIRDIFQNEISKESPELRAASKDYAIAKSAQKFKSLFPMTNSGKPAYFRTGAILTALKMGQPAALLGLPPVAGTATALSGVAGSVVKPILSEPVLRRSLFGGLGDKFIPSNPTANTGIINSTNNPPERINTAANSDNQKESIENSGNEGINHKVLDEKKAREYMKKANGDKKEARRMAIRDGYKIP